MPDERPPLDVALFYAHLSEHAPQMGEFLKATSHSDKYSDEEFGRICEAVAEFVDNEIQRFPKNARGGN